MRFGIPKQLALFVTMGAVMLTAKAASAQSNDKDADKDAASSVSVNYLRHDDSGHMYEFAATKFHENGRSTKLGQIPETFAEDTSQVTINSFAQGQPEDMEGFKQMCVQAGYAMETLDTVQQYLDDHQINYVSPVGVYEINKGEYGVLMKDETSGNQYLVDRNQNVKKVDLSDGYVTPVFDESAMDDVPEPLVDAMTQSTQGVDFGRLDASMQGFEIGVGKQFAPAPLTMNK